jgi:hypothetical protein
MTSVITSMGANDHVGVGGELIDDLALALVTPLSADDCYDGHPCSFPMALAWVGRAQSLPFPALTLVGFLFRHAGRARDYTGELSQRKIIGV